VKFRRPGKATPKTSMDALTECVLFCLESETFPVFAAWVKSQPGSPSIHQEDEQALRDDIEMGLTMIAMVQRLAPVMMRKLPPQ
jgi:hypothetical protein